MEEWLPQISGLFEPSLGLFLLCLLLKCCYIHLTKENSLEAEILMSNLNTSQAHFSFPHQNMSMCLGASPYICGQLYHSLLFCVSEAPTELCAL